MSDAYGRANRDEAQAAIRRAHEVGITFLDTANVYGSGANEQLVGEVIAGHRQEFVIATKFGLAFPGGQRVVNGRPEYVKACCNESLSRLGVDYVDLYYQHRVDPAVPIEETVGAMADLVGAGKVRYLGLSEASGASLERAATVHPISALQSEWSLWTRDLEAEVLAVARRTGTGIVPYSPLGRGFLTGAVTAADRLDTDDSRHDHPRFQGANLQNNMDRLTAIRSLAEGKGISAGQIALAWLLSQGEDVVPIPGTKRPAFVDENAGACDVVLTADELTQLDAISPPGAWAGERVQARFAPGYGDSAPRS
jgi:aryl-alcohol dehydrogenase-like predicted oxidoreductase